MSAILHVNMAKKWRQILERLEAEDKKRTEWEEEHPPITHISKQEADAKRRIQPVGQESVVCDLPCYGNNIPREYSHTGGMVNVFNKGIIVKGWENPEEGFPAYFGIICALAHGKICVVKDEVLRRAIEK